MGFMQFLPSTWRAEAALAPGGPRDPYRLLDAMVVAGSYLHRIEVGWVGGGQHDLRGALAVYGEVIEQNLLDFSPTIEAHWQTFDLRSAPWPDPAEVGFVVAPT